MVRKQRELSDKERARMGKRVWECLGRNLHFSGDQRNQRYEA